MGDARKSKARFFAENRRCAFCAGEAPAEEQDHQPGRLFFRERAWPEGFVFPACRSCNAVSSDSENVVSLIAFNPTSERDRSQYENRVSYLQEKNPEIFERLSMSSNEKRRALRKSGHKKPEELSYSELPVVRLPANVWHPHVKVVAQKIMLALHYQCFKEPLSRKGGLWIYWQTNASYDRIVNDEILAIANNLVLPTREKKLLDDQFSIRWQITEKPRTGLFIVHLQNTLFIAGITAEEPEIMAKKLNAEMLRPFGGKSN